MNCTTDPWSFEDTKADLIERQARTINRQRAEIERLEARVAAQIAQIESLRSDRPVAELIALFAAEPFAMRAFGWGLFVATGFWWVMVAP